MHRKKKTIHLILWKYRQKQTLSNREETSMYKWVAASELHMQLFDELSNDSYWDNEVEAFQSKPGDPAWNIIDQRLDDIAYFEDKPVAQWKKYVPMAAAAAVITLVSVIVLKKIIAPDKLIDTQVSSVLNKSEEVLPASVRATLTLGDGTVVPLDETGRKMLTMERFGMFISVGDGSLEYRTDMSVKTEQHKLFTPFAAQFRVKLPDGSMVKLNAGSSLRFPTAFDGNVREVELTGEGYFEVAKMPSKRFIVKVGKSSINVLGTHFNINAYKDENAMVTTLVEGSVLVKTENDSIKLVPGEKAIVVNDQKLNVARADVNTVLGWTEKEFRFNETPIPDIMRQIARWYNIKVVYKGKTEEKFTGILSRDLTLGQILTILGSDEKVSFEVKDKTVMVVP